MTQSYGIPFAFILLVFAAVLVSGLFWFRKYTGLSGGKAFLALFGSLLPGVLWIIRMGNTRPMMIRESELQYVTGNLAKTFLCVFLTAFVLRLWGRWIGDKATAGERLPGQPGVRAWFGTANVLVGLFIVVCAWQGYDISPVFSAVGVAAALAVYPLMRMESPLPAPAPVADDLSAEREKIVSMLQAGKLTAEESAELLQVLGGTSRGPARTVPLTGGQRLMLIGAALVALGFFLPWFVINPGREASRLFGQMQSSMGSVIGNMSIPQPPGYPPGGGLPQPPAGYPPAINTGEISISGGDIQHGLGWAVLALALSAALLPYVATALDAATARTVRLLCLGVGGFIVLYLLSQNLRFVSIGLVMAASGYALEAAGALRERRAASPTV